MFGSFLFNTLLCGGYIEMKINKNIELMQGDCLELLKKIEDESVDAIVTDPPYFLGLTHNGHKGCFNDLAICRPFYETLFKEYKRILKPESSIYFFTDWRGVAFYYPLFDSILKAQNLLVWEKLGRPTPAYYGYGYELILFSGKIKKSYASNIIKNIPSFNTMTKGVIKTNGGKLHPTQKPIELIEKFILDSTNEGNIVLDSFMGSGTTGVACINTNRGFIGMELDEKYFDITVSRCKDALIQRKEYLFKKEEIGVS